MESTINKDKLTSSDIKENTDHLYKRAISVMSNLNELKNSLINEDNKFNNYSQNNKNNYDNINSKESDKSKNDIQKLREKIQEQAARLLKLEKYKCLCENRILQLDPSHTMPVIEEHLKNHIYQSKNNKQYNSNNNYDNFHTNEIYQNEIYSLNQNLIILKEELKTLENKNLFLENKIKNNSISEMQMKNQKNNSSLNLIHSKTGFPFPLEKIHDEKSLRENYHNLFILYNDNIIEKNHILDTLKIETINNEEQKNYMEILKQTIDSFIMKNSFTRILNQIKKQYYDPKNNNFLNDNKNVQIPNNIDFLTEITILKNDVEKYRKESVLTQALINELKREIEFLKNNNTNLMSNKEKIIENLENLLRELDQAKFKLRNLENENEILIKEAEINKENDILLREELENFKEIAANLNKENIEINSKFSEIKSHLENIQNVQNKTFDYKKSFDKIYLDLNDELKKNKNLEDELTKCKNNLDKYKSEDVKLKEDLKMIDLIKNNLLDEISILKKNINLLEETNKEIENENKIKEKEIQILNNKLNLYSKDSNKNSNYSFDNSFNINNKILENEKLNREFEDYKKDSIKVIENLQYKLEEIKNNNNNNNDLLNLQQSIHKKPGAYETLKIESCLNPNNNTCNFINTIDLNHKKELENENFYLNNKINLLDKEIQNKTELLQKYKDKYDKLFIDFNQAEILRKSLNEEKENAIQDSLYWKKKYDQDLMKKINEIQLLENDLCTIQKEVSHNQETINNLKKYFLNYFLFSNLKNIL